MALEHLNVETFKLKVFDYEKNKEWKYEGKVPALIDFYANWCG
ncbi:MAG: thiol reductase thioredoxin, partial [Candidatus Omnitrophica bacterium]|nr:thiol reductase thioredoxin [Candidatus Omnitrophota bacterium]